MNMTSAEAAQLFLRTLPEQPDERDALRLAWIIDAYMRVSYAVGIEEAKVIYFDLHPNKCKLLKGMVCHCFRCRADQKIGEASDAGTSDASRGEESPNS